MTIPGYIDLQVNGHKGVDFSSPDLTAEQVRTVAKQLNAEGTCGFLPTIITNSLDLYKRNISLIHETVVRYGLEEHILGIHLEGPFISREPGAVGAHNPAYVHSPDTDCLAQMIEWSDDSIKLLTVAAEIPGIEHLIAYATKQNITVSLGHQLAGADDINRAAAAGAKTLTHLGNGLPNLLPRHDNPIWNSLANDSLIPMLITDGHHLPAEFIKCVIQMKGADKIIIVSDASPITGMPPGRYRVLGNDAILEQSGKLHNPEKQCMVGSASTMRQCMKYLASLNILTSAELEKVGYWNPLRLIEGQTQQSNHESKPILPNK